MRPNAVIILLSVLLIVPSGVLAEGIQITPFLGYRVGGDFEDNLTGIELSLSESETYGIIFNRDTSPGTQAEFFYSFHPSSLTANGNVTPGVLTDVDVEYFHLGGKQYLGQGTARSFVVASVGATHFSPHAASLQSDTRFSLGLGGGVELGGEGRIGFRLEGRGFVTFFNDETAIFCGSPGGCAVFVEGNALLQFEALAGVTFKF